MDRLGGPNGFTRLEDLVNNPDLAGLPSNKENIPIVLVPGFSGWGPPLLGAINYWGGVEDMPKYLTENGYTVIISTIAPISSNWERACELYAQLTAGKFSMLDSTNKLVETLDLDVSYGTYLDPHPGPGSVPLTTSHRRRAVLLPGPSWTDFKWKWNKDHRVHFICHSQGGNTVRQLVSLMANGAGGLHDQYFATTGRDEWTISVTTLGTPHKGSTITNVLENLLSEANTQTSSLVGRLFATLSFQEPQVRAYDLQLDHWGICRLTGESFEDMRIRLEASQGPVWQWMHSRNNAFYDNSIEGVRDLHQRTIASSQHVCYFTFSFSSTEPFPVQWPPWMPEAFQSFPISLVDAVRDFLRSIPGLSYLVGALDWVRGGITKAAFWLVFARQVKFPDFLRWATQEVANRLLREQEFQLNLPGPGKYVPRKDVFPLMLPTVYAMGGQELSDVQKDILGQNRGDWFQNDGIVNTESMRGPDDDLVRDVASFPTSNLRGPGVRGVYWHFGTTGYLDHADEIGVWIEDSTARALKIMYLNLANLVSRIPV